MTGDVGLAVSSGLLQLPSGAPGDDSRPLGKSATVSGGRAQEGSGVVSEQATAALSVAAALHSPAVREAEP